MNNDPTKRIAVRYFYEDGTDEVLYFENSKDQHFYEDDTPTIVRQEMIEMYNETTNPHPFLFPEEPGYDTPIKEDTMNTTPIPCDCMTYQDDLGQTVCRTCHNDWYACECTESHKKSCPNNKENNMDYPMEDYVDVLTEDIQAMIDDEFERWEANVEARREVWWVIDGVEVYVVPDIAPEENKSVFKLFISDDEMDAKREALIKVHDEMDNAPEFLSQDDWVEVRMERWIENRVKAHLASVKPLFTPFELKVMGFEYMCTFMGQEAYFDYVMNKSKARYQVEENDEKPTFTNQLCTGIVLPKRDES